MMRGSIEEITSQVKTYLKTQYMNVNMDWLTGCVEFFCEENSNRSVNNQQLNNMVKSQWMLGDLGELCPGSLPPDLSKVIKCRLNDVYVLQMNAVFNIGTSAYQQLQKLNMIDQSNIEATNDQSSEPSSQRMLKLILTDGIQEISGIEYKSMRNLSSDLTPGTKMTIKGPVDCRRGVLMLEEKHVIILGGEVEDLLESNSCRNVLSKRIDADEAAAINFTRDSYRPPIARCNLTGVSESSHSRHNFNSFVQNERNPVDQDDENLNDVFDEYFDINQIDAIEREINKDCTEQTSGYVTPQNVAKKMKVSTLPSPNNSQLFHDNPRSAGISGDIADTDDFEHYYNDEMENICASVREVESINSIYPRSPESKSVKTNRNPYVYLKQLSQVTEDFLLNKTFAVKAQVLQQLSKLSVYKGDWVFKCTIIDGSGMLDVNISSDVLTQIIGYSPQETMAMKKHFNTNPALKDKLAEGIDNAQRKLQSLDSILHIAFQASGPCIVEIIEFNDHHLFQLQQRVQKIT